MPKIILDNNLQQRLGNLHNERVHSLFQKGFNNRFCSLRNLLLRPQMIETVLGMFPDFERQGFPNVHIIDFTLSKDSGNY
jgi:hypothetical protein